MSNEVKRITAASRPAIDQAIQQMIADMSDMWEGFECNGVVVPNAKWGAEVEFSYLDGDTAERWTSRAQIFRAGDEFICVADFYFGEDSAFQGTRGNWYTIDDSFNMIED